MTELNNNFFYSDPPETDSFHSLFLYFWNHGIGLRQQNGVPIPWNASKLEAAFDQIKRPIDVRSIDNWRAGKSIPRRKNLLALATIAAAGDTRRRKVWAENFIRHYENKEANKPLPDLKDFEENNYPQIPVKSTKTLASLANIRSKLALSGLLIFSAFFSWNYFGSLKSHSIELDEIVDIRVEGFANNTDKGDFDFLIDGFESEIINTLYQINGARINSKKADPSNTRNITVVCDLAGQEAVYKLFCRIIASDGEILWSRQNSFKDPGDFIEIQSIFPSAVSDVSNIVLSEDSKERMRMLGTSSLDGYLAYLKGRKSLKNWHQSGSDPEIHEAFNDLSLAIEMDPGWPEPKFHIVDIYHHHIAGDISPIRDISPQSAAKLIPIFLEDASNLATSEFEKSKAIMNARFFSEDWTSLGADSKTYVSSAISQRGELEWLFEPVILLVAGQTDLLRSLVSDRILKFDSGNGTGHAYMVRSYILEGRYREARARFNSSNEKYFSNRLDQVHGYLLFAEKNFEELASHVENAQYLTQDYRDYFKILSLASNADTTSASKILEKSSALKANEIHYALAHFHLGEIEKGQELLEKIALKPLGDLDISTEIAYGAACNVKDLILPNSLHKKFLQANIQFPKCLY